MDEEMGRKRKMLIKRQKGLRTKYYNAKDIKEMGISKSQMGLQDYHIIRIYWIQVEIGDSTKYMARYLEEQDAVNELERFKAAVLNKDEKFEFARCDKLEKRIAEAEKTAVEIQRQRQEEKQKEKQKEREMRIADIEHEIKTKNKRNSMLRYITTFLIYGIAINAGVKYIKSPLALVTAEIVAGVVGAALIMHAKGGKENEKYL